MPRLDAAAGVRGVAEETRAEAIARSLDRPIAYLGVVALVLWLGEPFVTDTDSLRLVVDLVWVAIAVAFLVEFAVRAFVAPKLGPFLRRHWWELGLIVLPFLRFLRALRAARAGRGIAAAVRSTRSAGQGLRNRLFVLLLVTALVSVAGGRLLWEFGGYRDSYADAIHDSAMSTVTGSALGNPGAFAQVLEIILAVYSAVVIATIAGALGAFFLEGKRAEDSSGKSFPRDAGHVPRSGPARSASAMEVSGRIRPG